jgi:copper chaperone CopZ
MTASQIPLTLRDASGCACCASGVGASTQSAPAEGATIAADYGLLGLTCGGCASRVAAGLKELDGVIDASVTPVPGGISTARITSARPLEDAEVAGAVARAGYRLAEGPIEGAADGASSCCSD